MLLTVVLHWQYTAFLLVLLSSAVITAVLAAYAWEHRSVDGAVPFTATLLLMSVWSLAHLLELAETDLPGKVFWFKTKYLILNVLPVPWLAVTLQYTGRDKWLTLPRLAGLLAFPFGTAVLLSSGDLSRLVFPEAFLDSSGPFPMLGRTYGPWFWIQAAYSYIILVASVPLLLGMLIAFPRYRGQVMVLLTGMLLPVVWSILYIVGLSPFGRLDESPVVAAVTGILWAWALFRFRLFDIVPVARGKVVEGMSDGVIVLDTKGQIVDLNPAAQRILGRQPSQTIGLQAAEAFAAWPELIDLCCGSAARETLAALDASGGQLHYEVHLAPLIGRRGRQIGQVIGLHDITERVRSQEALQEANERLTIWVSELEQRNREMAILNEMGEALQSSPTREEVCAAIVRSAQQLFPGGSGGLFLPGVSGNAMEAVATWGESPPGRCRPVPGECSALQQGRVHVVDDPLCESHCRHLGSPPPVAYLCAPLVAQGEVLGVLHLRFGPAGPARERLVEGRKRLAITVAEHVALALASLNLRQTLREQAIRDPLTGLFNRRYMEETLERELWRARRSQSHLGIIMLDIDHFKRLNDAFGHAAGDALLSALGSYLRTHVRGEDIVCRYGGDEFTLILPWVPLEVTRWRAEDLREGIKQLRVEHRHQLLGPVAVSMGVADFPEHGQTGEEVLRAADVALYRAKSKGRDRVEMAALSCSEGASPM